MCKRAAYLRSDNSKTEYCAICNNDFTNNSAKSLIYIAGEGDKVVCTSHIPPNSQLFDEFELIHLSFSCPICEKTWESYKKYNQQEKCSYCGAVGVENVKCV